MTQPIPAELLTSVSDYVATRMGLFFPKERHRDLERGLSRAAAELGFDDAESCARWLLLTPFAKSQIEILASHLTVGETYFFRDAAIFAILEERIFPELIRKRRDGGRTLRVWSAGCATGEEPYSIAILLKRMIQDIEGWNVTVLATDINPLFLRKAASGVYGEWSFRDVPPWVRQRYFRSSERGRYEILPEIKKIVTFSYLNLAEDPYPSLQNNTNAMDLIFCRNVLMYLARDRQLDVAARLHRCLLDEGVLVVSPAEISNELFSAFLPARYEGATIYGKRAGATAAANCPVPTPPPSPFIPRPSPLVPRPARPPLAEPIPPPAEPAKREDAAAGATPPPDPFQEAMDAFTAGQYAESEERLCKILAEDHGHAPSLALLARVRANTGALGEARELCEKAVSAEKLQPGYHYLLAMILQEMGFPEESGASLKRAVYLDEGFALAHFALGNLALRDGKDHDAQRHFGNALAAIAALGRDDILPESEGITAGRMEEVIRAAMREEAFI